MTIDPESNDVTGTDAAESCTGDDELPSGVVDEAVRLSRLARTAVDPDEASVYRERRGDLIEEYDFVPRVRDADDTLVCYPAEWVVDGTVQLEEIEDTDRAVEVSLAGPGAPENWEAVEEHNAAVVDAVAGKAGSVHARNARAFADFMGNHYAREVQTATDEEIEEFRTEYFERNAWPTAEQRDCLEQSLTLVFECAKEV